MTVLYLKPALPEMSARKEISKEAHPTEAQAQRFDADVHVNGIFRRALVNAPLEMLEAILQQNSDPSMQQETSLGPVGEFSAKQ